MIHWLKKAYPGTPIQMCLFHQTQIIRRYITTRPQSECAQQLKTLMTKLTTFNLADFANALNALMEKHRAFLSERNPSRGFKHRRIRSALRSLKSNLPYLFAYKEYPSLEIPNTTNSCEGSFAHWKQKLKIHRGLRQHRQDKMFRFLIHQPTQNPTP